MKHLLLSIAIIFSVQAFACNENGTGGIVEDNDLYIPTDAITYGGLTEAQFNAVIEKIETIYVPIAKNMGGTLKIARKWTDGTVNANASRAGSIWNVNMYGGLARHETITEDGFALVLCHEIGHHLGGAPKNGSFMNMWASNEGQSDYFANLKCLRKAFLNDDNGAIVASLNAPEALKTTCAKTYGNKDDRNLCIRGGMAGMSVARLFAALRKQPDPKFETPDTSVVTTTNNAHPATQCRLDTYFAGSICDISFNEDVSQKDEVKGTCHRTLGHTAGVRPACWFKTK